MAIMNINRVGFEVNSFLRAGNREKGTGDKDGIRIDIRAL
jgi:hypothetical protein